MWLATAPHECHPGAKSRQNFADATNFVDVWRKTRAGRKKMACKFLKELEARVPAAAYASAPRGRAARR
jgi:hypothetical protein